MLSDNFKIAMTSYDKIILNNLSPKNIFNFCAVAYNISKVLI